LVKENILSSFNKYQKGVEALMESINAGSDAWKVALTNRAPVVASDSTLTDASEISAGNGYTAGGNAATTTSSAQTGGTYKLILASPTAWTATGGSLGPFRYAVLYDSTTDNLIGYWDYGSSVTLATGESFTVSLDGTNGVFTVA
jgi:hypothetical protein